MTSARDGSNRSAMRDRGQLLKSAAIRARDRRERVTIAGFSTGGREPFHGWRPTTSTGGREPFAKICVQNDSRPPVENKTVPDPG
jgi:hypothetical protein